MTGSASVRQAQDKSSLQARAKNAMPAGRQDNLLLLSISNTDAIVDVISEIAPKLVVIDSIQTMESENLTGLSGSVGQVRYAAGEFIKIAKS